MGQVIRDPWQRQYSELRRLVESTLRRLHFRREQPRARRTLDNLHCNVLAEERANASQTPIVWPATD